MNIRILTIAAAVLLTSCGDAEQEAQKTQQAPDRPPMALDPSPPMSAADIDAIVNSHSGANAPAAAAGQNRDGQGKTQ